MIKKVELMPRNTYDNYGYFISKASDVWISEISREDHKIEIKAKLLDTSKLTVKDFIITVHDNGSIIKGVTDIDNGILKVMANLGPDDYVTTHSLCIPTMSTTPHFAFFVEPHMVSVNNDMAQKNSQEYRENLKKELLDLGVPNVIAYNILNGE